MSLILKLVLLLLTTTSMAISSEKNESKITFVAYHTGGRSGDRLVDFVNNRLKAFQNNANFCYLPFPYSDQFHFSQYLPVFKQSHNKIKNWNNKDTSGLFHNHVTFSQDLVAKIKSNKRFLKLLRNDLSPINKKSLDIISPPDGYDLTIALHIRKDCDRSTFMGSQQIFEQTDGKRIEPEKKFKEVHYNGKFFPEQFYVNEIKKIAKKNPNKLIYCFVFTDDPIPANVAERIRKAVNLSNVTIGSRDLLTLNTSVLDDLYSMGNFSVLICPFNSHYSEIASLLFDFQMVIYPAKWQWQSDLQGNPCLVVTSSKCRKINHSSCKTTSRRLKECIPYMAQLSDFRNTSGI